eukprot:UN09321
MPRDFYNWPDKLGYKSYTNRNDSCMCAMKCKEFANF